MKTIVVVMISVCGGSNDYILTERRGMSELHYVGRRIDMPVVDVMGEWGDPCKNWFRML